MLQCFMNVTIGIWDFRFGVVVLLGVSGWGFSCYNIAVAVLGIFGTGEWKGAMSSGLQLKNSCDRTSLTLVTCNGNNKNILC